MSVITVAELIEELEKLPPDDDVMLSVFYDNCEHIQPLGEVFHAESECINWITLRGQRL